MATTIRNWDGSQSWQPEQIHRPADEEAIIALIQQAAAEGKRLKPVGKALSWSDIADMPTLAMQFDNMARILDVDRGSKRIRLQAGVPLMRVNEALANHGLALDNFGSIVKQTAAGYIATASHGTGIRTRILSTYVDNMRLIDGLGQVHELDAGNEPELFAAARVHLGCLGAVTELTLRCVEAFDLEERGMMAITAFRWLGKSWPIWIPSCRTMTTVNSGGCHIPTRSRSIPSTRPIGHGAARDSMASWTGPGSLAPRLRA